MSSNHQFSSQYSKGLHIQSTDNEEEDYPPEFTTLAHEIDKSKWSHIDDLDEFFTRVYQYHQNHGMPSLVFLEFLNLFQILFLASFSVFMLECVDYETLFQSQKVVSDQAHNNSAVVKKNSISDVVFPLSQCVARISFKLWLVLIVVIVFWMFRLIKAIYNIARYAEIRSFYVNALNIQTKDLQNITWHEVQEKLLQCQKKYHLCVHKQELTELDIYHRILRFKNYEVAMVNQGLLPPKINVPFLGQVIFLTTGFKYNFEFLFFWGPFAPFRNCYQLRPEFKVFSKRADLTRELSRSILILGVLNLALAPAIFLWQLLQFLYNYTELIKRDPGSLGSRKWSAYSKLYFRHFNELDHELDARLSRAHKPAMLYLASFVSKFLVVCAKFFVFTFGAIFAVLVILTIYDEDVLNVEHVLTLITASGAVAGIARSLIPDENTVYFMDQMMYQILAQVHYMPDAWVNHANSYVVRDEFVKLLQYKFAFYIEELLSPIVTPWILLFWLRPRSARLVDFLRNFTVEVVGVGDVCSFAQMDTRKHGNPKWLSRTSARRGQQARNGKTELSLIHFVHTNPQWRMPSEAQAFLDQLKEQAIREGSVIEQEGGSEGHLIAQSSVNNNQASVFNQQSSLNKSLYHLQSLVYNSNLQSNLIKSNAYSTIQQQQSQLDPQQQSTSGQMPRGAVSRIEGPLFVNKQKTLLTIAQASTLQLSQTMLPVNTPTITTALENNLDMCFSALYMHELHRKYHHGDYIDLDNVKEENDDNNEENNNFDNDEDQSGNGGESSRPLLNSNGQGKNAENEGYQNSDSDNETVDNTLINAANTFTTNTPSRVSTKSKANNLIISYSNKNPNDNTVINM